MKIDKEFQDLIPTIEREEFKQLEQNILRDGCLSPLIAWKGLLLDGHNRFEICEKHHKKYKVEELDLKDRAHALLWIEENQVGRRNISEDQKAEMSRSILIRRRQIALVEAGGIKDGVPVKQVKAVSIEDVSRETRIPVAKIKKADIIHKADPKLSAQVRQGKVTIKEAHKKVQAQMAKSAKKKPETTEQAKVRVDKMWRRVSGRNGVIRFCELIGIDALRKAYFAAAKGSHSDAGGSDEAMQELNFHWEQVEEYFKSSDFPQKH